MPDFDKALVVTHIVFRKSPPFDALEGPYSSVMKALSSLGTEVETCQIPIFGFSYPICYGSEKNLKKLKIPSFLGKIVFLKYIIDIILGSFFLIKFLLKNIDKKKIIIGIDPLSCLPLALLKPIFGYKLVFYSVDFNKNRFNNKIMQCFYEKSDEISTKLSDQTWVICQSLKDYKKVNYSIDSTYIPNSAIFNEKIFQEGKKFKKGNKIAWTGSLLTEKQYGILFGTLREIQDKSRPDMEFYFAPMQNHKKFKDYGKKFGLKKFAVLELHSRAEWQKFAATCDVGIAIYDPQFGSTEFIEPLKIWDFMMCGMPFIISCEPSISEPIKKAKVVYILKANNEISKDKSLNEFLKPKNLKEKQEKCLELAREYDIKKQIEKRLSKL